MLRFSLFLTSVMVASTSTAGGVPQCSVDTAPIQIVGESGSSPETTLSAAKPYDFAKQIGGSYPHFNVFVTAVTEYVAARLGRDNICLNSAESKERSLLQFMHWRLLPGNNLPAPMQRLDAWPSGGCRISSPWIDLAFERKPVPWIRGIVRWNQRQLLADQAALAGAQNVPPDVAVPLTNSEISHFVAEYARSEFRREPAAKPVEERIPPDILWLLRRSPQTTAIPFIGLVRGSMHNATEKSAEGYTKLVIALIDRCLASDEADIHYDSILDVANPTLLEQYKIVTPLY